MKRQCAGDVCACDILSMDSRTVGGASVLCYPKVWGQEEQGSMGLGSVWTETATRWVLYRTGAVDGFFSCGDVIVDCAAVNIRCASFCLPRSFGLSQTVPRRWRSGLGFSNTCCFLLPVAGMSKIWIQTSGHLLSISCSGSSNMCGLNEL